MKTTLSLQFKLLIAVALVIVLTLSVLIYLVVNSQRKLSRASFRDLAIALAQALGDTGIKEVSSCRPVPRSEWRLLPPP